ncbi:MAG TPA: D-arabinono-1,4-lactone oxidase [Solirubrobacteraceae bacterium]|nr:D-arabinono-1,4-lactone oxidase [Solirubrobacteraceae bacterium]
MAERNWAENLTFSAATVEHPRDLEELRAVIAGAPRVRVLGARHSFNAIADSSELVSLRELSSGIDYDGGAGTVTCGAGVTYGALARELTRAGLALANLPSLPHVSVAGAIATATHGSGNGLGNLATSVEGLELITSTGELIGIRRGDPDFAGAVVHLGALGAVTRVTLRVEPSYDVRQEVFEHLSWDALEPHFEELMALGDSVSVFTTWGEAAGRVWVKRRSDRPGVSDLGKTVFGARAAGRQLHPIDGGDPSACTPQLAAAGPWNERLPHFRPEFTPSAGEELQSEYLLARRDGVAAIAALRSLRAQIRPLLHVSEIRTVAGDDLWLSPEYGRDSVAIHFTWQRRQREVERVLETLEQALEPFAPRPHWGKLFVTPRAVLAARYEHLDDFRALAARLDPRGAFSNGWLEQRLLGD